MNELFNRFNEKERKQLSLLSLVLLVSLIFLIFVSLGQRRGYFNRLGQLQRREKAAADAEARSSAAAAEWANWEQAGKDLAELKSRYFYKEEDGINQIRIDLRNIFSQAGINPGDLRYDYVEKTNEGVKKVNISFNFTGSYPILKRFLAAVEEFPRFLTLEQVSIPRIESQGNLLELKIILAAYYESF
jgi:Tfp pilus assembly protein PilO